jgi:hypothetical protein
MSTVKDLLDAINNTNHSLARDIFSDLMQDRVFTAVEAMREPVAKEFMADPKPEMQEEETDLEEGKRLERLSDKFVDQGTRASLDAVMKEKVRLKAKAAKSFVDDAEDQVDDKMKKFDPKKDKTKYSKVEEENELEEKYIGFKKLEGKLEAEGKSKDSADKIAVKIGERKYGKARFMAAAHAHKPMKGMKPKA